MSIPFNFVRCAMAAHAKTIGRDEYSLITMREVFNAIQKNTDHPLKNIVLDNLDNGKALNREIRLKQENDLVESVKNKLNADINLRAELAHYLGISLHQLNRHVWGKTGLSVDRAKEYQKAIAHVMANISRRKHN